MRRSIRFIFIIIFFTNWSFQFFLVDVGGIVAHTSESSSASGRILQNPSFKFAHPLLSNWLFVQRRIRTKCVCHGETKPGKSNKIDLHYCKICCYSCIYLFLKIKIPPLREPILSTPFGVNYPALVLPTRLHALAKQKIHIELQTANSSKS